MRRVLVGTLLTLSVIACGDKAATRVEPPKSFPIFENGKFGFINASGEITIRPTYEYWGRLPTGGRAPTVTQGPNGAGIAGTVRQGTSLRGSLSGANTFYIIAAGEGSSLQVSVAADWDSMLELYQYSGGSWRYATSNDDYDGLNPRVTWFQADVGPIGVMVKSYDGSGGAFTLTVGGTEGRVAADFGFVDELRFHEGLLRYRVADRWGFLGENGEIAINPQFEAVSRFQNGLAAVRQKDKWGFVDTKGALVIAPTYDQVAPFSADGLAPVAVGEKCGFISRDGAFAIGPRYDDCSAFVNGIAVVEDDDLWGVIDKEGTAIIAPQFRGLSDFVGDHAAARSGDKWGIIDRDGRYVVQPQYEQVAPPVEGNLWLVRAEGKYGFIDVEGKYVVGPVHDEAGVFHDGVARVRMGDKWSFVNADGKPVGSGAQYDAAEDMSNGLAAVRMGDSWGFVNKTGEMVIAPKYVAVGRFDGSVAAVLEEDRIGYVDRTGKVVRVPSK